MDRLVAIFLSFLILTTNVGLTFATHYCGGKAVKAKIMFGSADLSCGMTEEETTQFCDRNSQSPTIRTNGCCENQYVQLEIEDDYNGPTSVENTVDYNFIAAFVISYISLYSFNAFNEVEFLNYSPPLLKQDIPVLIQSFLI